MTTLKFTVAANAPRMITRVKQQNHDLSEDEIYFGGPIVAAGEKLKMGDGDTIRIELYEGGAPVAHLDEANNSIKNVVSIPTAISFSINNNGSARPDMHLCRRHQVPLRATRGALRKQSRKGARLVGQGRPPHRHHRRQPCLPLAQIPRAGGVTRPSRHIRSLVLGLVAL